MPITKNDITVAYMCPVCGNTVMSLVGVFALTGDRITIKCSTCKSTEMEITKTQDGKLRFKYPCALCGTDHTQIIPLTSILSRDLLTFPCMISGFDSLFIGTKGKVIKATEETSESINDFVMKSNIEDYLNAPKIEYDPHILDLVLYTIKELASEGKIICDCKDGGQYNCTINRENVNIRCKKCNKCENIDCSEGSMQARDLFDRTSLVLTKDYEGDNDNENEQQN